MAEALGAEVTLVTGIPKDYDGLLLSGLRVVAVPAASCPRYENRYAPTGEREQHLYHEGSALDEVDWAAVGAGDVAIIAPAFHEFSSAPQVVARTRATALQGILRMRLPDNRVRPRRDAISSTRRIVGRGELAFLSEHDTANPQRLAATLAKRGAIAVVTRAEQGALLYTGDTVHAFPAVPANQVEPTGAGDCFATSFTLRYHETGSLEEAMRFGLAAGSLAVEGRGMACIPDRGAIERRARQVAA